MSLNERKKILLKFFQAVLSVHSVLIAQQLPTHVLSMFFNFFCWLLNFQSITFLRYLTLSFKHISKSANASAQFKAFNVPTALYGHMKRNTET